jgi:hypothetical protein
MLPVSFPTALPTHHTTLGFVSFGASSGWLIVLFIKLYCLVLYQYQQQAL